MLHVPLWDTVMPVHFIVQEFTLLLLFFILFIFFLERVSLSGLCWHEMHKDPSVSTFVVLEIKVCSILIDPDFWLVLTLWQNLVFGKSLPGE